MSLNPLPPSGYTKDTLVKAFQWMKSQGDGIKELASSPDLLVSLYLKAQREGQESLERPSIQNFKNELKSLAGMMGELDDIKANPHQNFANQPQASSSFQPQANQTSPTQPLISKTNSQVPQTLKKTPTEIAELNLDPRSVSMIQEIRWKLNLSSEQEALRLLITLGHQKAKNFAE